MFLVTNKNTTNGVRCTETQAITEMVREPSFVASNKLALEILYVVIACEQYINDIVKPSVEFWSVALNHSYRIK